MLVLARFVCALLAGRFAGQLVIVKIVIYVLV